MLLSESGMAIEAIRIGSLWLSVDEQKATRNWNFEKAQLTQREFAICSSIEV